MDQRATARERESIISVETDRPRVGDRCLHHRDRGLPVKRRMASRRKVARGASTNSRVNGADLDPHGLLAIARDDAERDLHFVIQYPREGASPAAKCVGVAHVESPMPKNAARSSQPQGASKENA